MEHKRAFIIAVSGGVDSVVLLYKIMRNNNSDISYIVAHFDHGTREDSAEDAAFVAELADTWELQCELGYGKLGEGASEEQARQARYAFLEQVQRKHGAEKIVTAHHQDDLLETMLINIIRGTSPRGLAPMQNSNIVRPLITKTKAELIQYAKNHDLTWREDSSNTDTQFLRNYLRLNMMPKLYKKREALLEINKHIARLYHEIDLRIRPLVPTNNILLRSQFVVLPASIQREVMRAWLMRSGITELDFATIERLSLAACTQQPGTKVDIKNDKWLQCEKQNVLITSK